jgi:hypothetical protein
MDARKKPKEIEAKQKHKLNPTAANFEHTIGMPKTGNIAKYKAIKCKKINVDIDSHFP